MSWNLAGVAIQAPQKKSVKNDVQEVVHRTLNGTYSRDFIGTAKKVIECEYSPISETEYQKLLTAYEDQRDNGTTKNLFISEDGFDFSANVLIRIDTLDFNLPNHYNYRNVKVTFTEI